MPSPVGHLLAGAAVALTVAPRGGHRLAIAVAALAAAPDLDLLLPVQHRTVTHSVAAVAAVAVGTILAIVVTRQVTARARIVAVCSLAVASHMLLDWLGPDPVFPHGLQMLWPFSDRFYISGWDLFKPTARTGLFTRPTMVRNLTAVAYETAVLGPVVLMLWLVRVKTAARLPAKMAGRDHAAQ